jgi:hypothetical protein
MLHVSLDDVIELRHVERLVNKITGPGTERANGRCHATECSDHDHERVWAVPSQLLAKIETIHILEIQVDDDQRKLLLSREREPVVPAQAPLDARPTAFQAFSNQLAHALIVVDHQYLFRHLTHPFGASAGE